MQAGPAGDGKGRTAMRRSKEHSHDGPLDPDDEDPDEVWSRGDLSGVRRHPRVRPRRRAAWQLGVLEYVLLTVIALSVAVTIAMAIFNP